MTLPRVQIFLDQLRGGIRVFSATNDNSHATPPNVVHGEFNHPSATQATEAFNRASALDSDPKTYEDAEKLYREALRLDPRFCEALINLGNLRHRRRDSFEAIECYRAAIRIDHNQAEAHYNTGCVYDENGTPARAIPHYRAALTVVRDDIALEADIHYRLAVSLDETSDVIAAREHWQRYIDLAPQGEWIEQARQWLVSTTDVHTRYGRRRGDPQSRPQLVAIRGGKS